MPDSPNPVEACACGGFYIHTSTRRSTPAKAEHHDAEGNTAPCPNDD
ncbi:hypothetical protein [Streptomyces sp. NPDC001091]